MIFYCIYLVLCFVVGAVASSCGYGIDTWQWWVCLIGICGAYLCGIGSEKTK